MRSAALAAVAMMLAVPSFAGTVVNPTTTLAAETANNTSASSSFTTLSDGDHSPGNVSKVPTRSLLYSGANSGIYAHFMAWFGGTNHMNVGYRSDDPAQVHRQVTDMMSRGIQGAIVDWYGPNNREDTTTQYLMQDAETRGGQFFFAVNMDGGALKNCANTVGCSTTQTLINDLNYAYTKYENSPAYLRFNGRPVVTFFSVDTYSIDWNLVRSGVSGNPIFIFRNSGAFTHAQTDGGFSWVGISSSGDSAGLGYLDNFYSTALKYPGEYAIGSGYAGFNDTLASWGKNRIVPQQCGQTWLGTFADAGKHYSASNQLDAVQLVTWNDYEEGSEIETGIDNCVSISAVVSGSTLSWSITGQENTIDHYTVFISTDGQNLMPLKDVPAGTHSLSLSSFGLLPGSYVFYVKAVAKPTLFNHMSAAVNLAVVSGASVTIAAPTASTVMSPTNVVASAQSQYSVTAMKIYVDSVLQYQTSAATLNTSLALAPGNHNISVQAWDSSGATFMSAVTVRVLSSPKKTVRWRGRGVDTTGAVGENRKGSSYRSRTSRARHVAVPAL